MIGIGALTGRLNLAETLGNHLPKSKTSHVAVNGIDFSSLLQFPRLDKEPRQTGNTDRFNHQDPPFLALGA